MIIISIGVVKLLFLCLDGINYVYGVWEFRSIISAKQRYSIPPFLRRKKDDLFLVSCNFCPLFLRYYSVKGQDSFNELLLHYRSMLFHVCRRYCHDGLTADDLLQETSLALWNSRDKLMSITSPPKQAAWIWRVARSTCIDLQRRTRQPMPIPDNYDMVEE